MLTTEDYEIWSECPTVTAYEVACLCCGVSPEIDGGAVPKPPKEVSRRDWEFRFKKLYVPLVAHIKSGTFRRTRTPGRGPTTQILAFLLRTGKVEADHPYVVAVKRAIQMKRLEDRDALLRMSTTPPRGEPAQEISRYEDTGKHWIQKRANILAAALCHLAHNYDNLRSGRDKAISATALASAIIQDKRFQDLSHGTLERHIREALRGIIPY